MEGLWITLGAVLSTLSGIVFWFLNSKSMRDTQERQQKHETEMQEQRLRSERQRQSEEAVRTMRRERLTPVQDILSRLDQAVAHVIWNSAVTSSEDTARVQLEQANSDDPAWVRVEQVPGLAKELWDEVMKELRDAAPAPSAQLYAEALSIFARVGDQELRADLYHLLSDIAQSKPDSIGRLAQVHARFESYAANIAEAVRG